MNKLKSILINLSILYLSEFEKTISFGFLIIPFLKKKSNFENEAGAILYVDIRLPRHSFTELSIVLSLIAVLFGFVTINLNRSQQNASITAIEQTLLSDLKQQQLKAMIGDTEGRASSDQYGVHFDSNQYVLFHGVYSVGDSTNFVISLAQNFQFVPA